MGEVMSKLGLARGFLLRRLCTLAFENLLQFRPPELALVALYLAKLRFLSQPDVEDLADVLAPHVEWFNAFQTSSVLFAFAMTDARHQMDFIRKLVGHYLECRQSPRTFIDFAWSIIALELVPEYKKDFSSVVEKIVKVPHPRHRVPLMKFFDVMCSLDHEHSDLRIVIPEEWITRCKEADSREMGRLRSSRLHQEIFMRLENMVAAARGTHWELNMEQNQPVGHYGVDLDKELKIALDVDLISWPT